jgi:hypothetical protein
MSGLDESLTLAQLRDRIGSVAQTRATNEGLEGLIAGFSHPSEQQRPIEPGLGEPGVIYAWRTEDADVIKAALDVLDGVSGLFDGSRNKAFERGLTRTVAARAGRCGGSWSGPASPWPSWIS